jgi:hypothetical protein
MVMTTLLLDPNIVNSNRQEPPPGKEPAGVDPERARVRRERSELYPVRAKADG